MTKLSNGKIPDRIKRKKEVVMISPDLAEFLKTIGVVNPESVTTKAAAAYLTIYKGVPTAASSLEVYRHRSCGPKYKKVRSRVFYTIPWLDEYADGVEINVFAA